MKITAAIVLGWGFGVVCDQAAWSLWLHDATHGLWVIGILFVLLIAPVTIAIVCVPDEKG